METPARPALPDVGPFFEESVRLFKARAWRLLGIGGAGSIGALVLSLIPVAAGAFAVGAGLPAVPVWVLAGAVSLSILLYGMSWAQASMIECALADDASAGAWDCCKRAWPKTAAFSWVCVLYLLLVIGGVCLFALPGAFLTIALLFAPIACVGEGVQGVAALKRSLDDTSGRFFAVAARLTLVGAATTIVGFVPVVGWLLSAVVGPFSLVALIVLYKQLKAEPRAAPSGRGWVLGVAAGGLLIPVLLSFIVVPRMIEQWPKIVEAGRQIEEAGQDPVKLQKALAVLQDGSTVEQVQTAVSLVTPPAVSTAPAAGAPAAPVPEPSPSK